MYNYKNPIEREQGYQDLAKALSKHIDKLNNMNHNNVTTKTRYTFVYKKQDGTYFLFTGYEPLANCPYTLIDKFEF